MHALRRESFQHFEGVAHYDLVSHHFTFAAQRPRRARAAVCSIVISTFNLPLVGASSSLLPRVDTTGVVEGKFQQPPGNRSVRGPRRRRDQTIFAGGSVVLVEIVPPPHPHHGAGEG